MIINIKNEYEWNMKIVISTMFCISVYKNI